MTYLEKQVWHTCLSSPTLSLSSLRVSFLSLHRMAGAGIHPYHQQWPPTGAPPPPAAVSSAPPPHPPPVHHHHHPPPPGLDNHNRPPYDEVNTSFVSS